MSEGALNLVQALLDERAALNGETKLPSECDGQNQFVAIESGQTLQVSLNELNGYEKSEHHDAVLNATYVKLLSDRRAALCFSGGGIRSAAFALGVTECLAGYKAPLPDRPTAYPKPLPGNPPKTPLLTHFDYISSVSGGGYLASWLSTWLAFKSCRTSEVVTALDQHLRDGPEPAPIAYLRRNTDYLSPRLSALSPDLWSGIAGVVRNLLLNWLVLAPPFLALVVATNIIAGGLGTAAQVGIGPWLAVLIWLATPILFIIALSFVAANRPTRRRADMLQKAFFRYDLRFWLWGSACLVLGLASDPGRGWALDLLAKLGFIGVEEVYRAPLAGAGAGALLYLVAWFAADLWSKRDPPLPESPHRAGVVGDWAAWVTAGALFGVVVGIGVDLWSQVRPLMPHRWAFWLTTLSVPWLLLARTVGGAIFAGLRGRVPESDSDLEWSARAGGIYGAAAVGILLWFGLVLIAPGFLSRHWNWVTKTLFGSGAAAGVGAAFLGKSQLTSIVSEIKTVKGYFGWTGLAVVAAAAFGIVVTIGAGALADALVFYGVFSASVGLGLAHINALVDWCHPRVVPIISLVILTALAFATSWSININLFSLHSIYRNRLVRAFLGASRHPDERRASANRFTDFASDDSLPIAKLWDREQASDGDNWRPLHIINATLNLISSRNLAWQERRAAPFTFSALHAGSGSTALRPAGAYRHSYQVGNQPPFGTPDGVRVGTAMAISGAAASPAMGYASSPGLSVLMTLFNVRLGWWMANPLDKDYSSHGPRLALWPLVNEMFGLTTENRPWVYLSDGGHFENLGLYEMVHRRCAVIVVCDAGCDPSYGFADLGNALRKIWIDLGVRIDMTGLDQLKKRFTERPTPATRGPYWATGHIRYPEAKDDKARWGRLLYLKAGLHGTEPMDIVSYAIAHRDFPHDTTANQFFTESQFESYRALGYVIMASAVAAAVDHKESAVQPESHAASIAANLELLITLPQMIDRLEASLEQAGEAASNLLSRSGSE
jgi:Patatin-like phospholipase